MRRRELALAGLGSALVGSARAQAVGRSEPIDWPVLTLLDGGTLTPASWLGRPALVVIWASWCPYCKRHNAHVDKLFRATHADALRVLGVAVQSRADAVRRTMADNGYGFPVVLDDGALRRRLTARRVVPVTCSIDRQGRLLQAIAGEMTEDDLFQVARTLQKPAAARE